MAAVVDEPRKLHPAMIAGGGVDNGIWSAVGGCIFGMVFEDHAWGAGPLFEAFQALCRMLGRDANAEQPGRRIVSRAVGERVATVGGSDLDRACSPRVRRTLLLAA